MRRNTGFTLMELMIAVGIITVLAGLAVSYFGGFISQSKAAEVSGMFAEIKQAEEAYKGEYGMYVSTGTDENDLYPALLGSGEPTAKQWNPPQNSPWATLGVSPVSSKLYCGYVAIAGAAGTQPSGTLGTNAYSGQTLATPWFYVVAKCDLDGDGADYSEFVSPHNRSDILEFNVGD